MSCETTCEQTSGTKRGWYLWPLLATLIAVSACDNESDEIGTQVSDATSPDLAPDANANAGPLGTCSEIHNGFQDGFDPKFLYFERVFTGAVGSKYGEGPTRISDLNSEILIKKDLLLGNIKTQSETPYLAFHIENTLCLVPRDGQRDFVEFDVDPDFVWSYRISADGGHTFWLQDGQILIGNLHTGTVVDTQIPRWMYFGFSPAGQHLVFMGPAPSFTLFTIQLDGSELTPLGQDAAWAVWSPDGSEVAWITPNDPESDSRSLHVADFDGGNSRTLVLNKNISLQSLAWTDNGIWFDELPWRTESRSSEPFHRVAPDGSDAIEIPLPDGAQVMTDDVGFPFPQGYYSPDGLHVAYRCETLNGKHLCLDSQIIGPPGVGPNILWAPDGSRLAFTTSSGSYTVNPDGSDLVQVNDVMTAVSWAPNATGLAFVGEGGVYVASPDGQSVLLVGSGTSPSAQIVWSTDSDYVYFLDKVEFRAPYDVYRASSSPPADSLRVNTVDAWHGFFAVF